MRWLAALGGLWLGMAGAAQAQGLRLGLPAAPGYASALTAVVLRPYTVATRVRVRVVPLQPAGWDIAQLGPMQLAAACQAGSIARIDWDRLGGRQRFLPLAVSDCGVGAYTHSLVLSWDTARLKVAPGWGEFWDVVRLPGGRGLHLGPMGTLEIALMADGVAPGDVYNVLRGQDGVARAFRKLDQLRPYIVWWKDDAEAMAIVASGRALMSSAPSEQVRAAGARLHRSFGTQWGGSIVMVQSWAIGARSRHADLAAALIGVSVDPGRQDALFGATGYGGTIVAAGTVAPAVAAGSPSRNLAHAVPFDAAFWRDNGAALARQFDDWLKH